MSADSSPPAAASPNPAPTAPLSERTAMAVLGAMLVLIVALTLLLIQTTWVDVISVAEPPATADGSLAQR